MKKYYIRAYQLMLEFTDIINMPDSVAKATKWHDWTVKAMEWRGSKPHRARLQIVQSACRPQQQNRDVINPPTLRTESQV